MSKRPIHYEDYASSTRYRIRRARARRASSSDDTPESSDSDIPIHEVNNVQEEFPEALNPEQAVEFPVVLNPEQAAEQDEARGMGNVLHPNEPHREGVLNPGEDDSSEAHDSSSSESLSNSSDAGDNFASDTETEEDEPIIANPNDAAEDPPLYPGAPISLEQSLLAILSFALSHNLTGSGLADLLSLIHLHCIQPCHCKISLYKFMKHFTGVQSPLVRHFFCSACFAAMDNNDDLCPDCNASQGVSYFVEVPIVSSVTALFSRPGFFERLSYRFQRVKENADNYEDIYDGSLYKGKSMGNNILSDQSNISLMWYTDGVRLFRSSKIEIWPLYFTVNELPYVERFKPENIIFAGLWFGLKKPVPELFLSPFLQSVQALGTGVEVKVPNMINPIRVRGVVLCGTCDLPAKALFLNMVQYNGKFGCQKCEIMGQRIHADNNDEMVNDLEEQGEPEPQYRRRGPGVQVYPFSRQLDLRTDDVTQNHAQQAVRNGRPVQGVKGPSALLYLCIMNYVTSTAIDVMHCLYSNIVSNLLDLWFNSNFHAQPFSMSRVIRIADQRLKALTPPAFVQRLPRLISERAYWKSSELKNWFYYYSVPVLCDLMAPEYFSHYLMLVMSMYLLNQSSISENEILLATQLITEYVNRYQDLYGLRFMTMNIHSLLHLPDQVRQMGPLWTTSCFPYENFNGTLKTLVHGTRFCDSQICRSVGILTNLPTLKTRSLIPGTPACMFCENISHRSLRFKTTRVSPTSFILGKCVKLQNLPPLVEDALNNSNVNGRNCHLFHRLLKFRTVYVANSYSRTLRTNSSVVKYRSNNDCAIGILQCFVRVTECVCDILCDCNAVFLAILKRCNTENPFLINNPRARLNFIYLCTQGIIEAVNIECLIHVCFTSNIITTQNVPCMYAVDPVNCKENE